MGEATIKLVLGPLERNDVVRLVADGRSNDEIGVAPPEPSPNGPEPPMPGPPS